MVVGHASLVGDEADTNGMCPIGQSESGMPPNFSYGCERDLATFGPQMGRQQFRNSEQNEVFCSFGEESPEADQSDIIREKRQYARWIETLLSLWTAAGPDWMT